ncbi:T9SS type A sorting domain-containing protein, partial [Lentimicrobium sp. L6]
MEEYSNSKEVLVRTCLGVNQQNGYYLEVYPNPATNQITFELPNINKQSQLQIKDIYGKVIATLIIKPNQSKLIWECSGIASGVYFYEGEISGEVYRGKFLVK